MPWWISRDLNVHRTVWFRIFALYNSHPSVTHFPFHRSRRLGEFECMTIVACALCRRVRDRRRDFCGQGFTNGGLLRHHRPRTNNYLSRGPPSQDASCLPDQCLEWLRGVWAFLLCSVFKLKFTTSVTLVVLCRPGPSYHCLIITLVFKTVLYFHHCFALQRWSVLPLLPLLPLHCNSQLQAIDGRPGTTGQLPDWTAMSLVFVCCWHDMQICWVGWSTTTGQSPNWISLI